MDSRPQQTFGQRFPDMEGAGQKSIRREKMVSFGSTWSPVPMYTAAVEVPPSGLIRHVMPL